MGFRWKTFSLCLLYLLGMKQADPMSCRKMQIKFCIFPFVRMIPSITGVRHSLSRWNIGRIVRFNCKTMQKIFSDNKLCKQPFAI